MADFLTAYKLTAINEGGYSNDPVDPGGQTWRGIARKKNPQWKGWAIIDRLIKGVPTNKIADVLSTDKPLHDLELDFYKSNFWQPVRGTELLSQEIANSLYDSAVNFGAASAIILAQRAAGFKETGIMNDSFLNHLNNK